MKLLVLGNSASGKTTLSRRLVDEFGLAHLDLDILAWGPASPPVRRPLAESGIQITAFIQSHADWVIEGCYADLLDMVTDRTAICVFLDVPAADCIANAKNRPWEPHKYPSKEAQDANLPMLLDWINEYPSRQDSLSRPAHMAFYDGWSGRKHHLRSRDDIAAFAATL